jgi:hypothetical protein
MAAAAIFLFGTTFLWFMPSFLGTATIVEGVIWSIIQLLVLATVIGYAGAAWGLYKATTWWRELALGGSIVGILVLVLWWLAVGSLSGVTNLAANLGLHAIGIAAMVGLLLVPSLGKGVDRRLVGRPRDGI